MIRFFSFILLLFLVYHISYEVRYGIQISKLKYRAPNFKLESCQCLEPLSEYWGFQNTECIRIYKSFELAAKDCFDGN